MAERFVSAPLVLPPGDYQITEFMVAYLGYSVLYATPLEGSPLAPLVDDPLPINFSVVGDAVTDTNVEVVDIRTHEAEDFGYATFGIVDVAHPAFQLAVFKPIGDELVLSRAHVYLLEGTDTVYNEYVAAAVNEISLVALNLDIYYTLIIEDESYKRYSLTSMIGNILYELQGNPMTITLEPALTFTARYGNAFFNFNIDVLDVYPTPVYSVDWGDGTTPELVDASVRTSISHDYTAEGPHHVSMSGSLDALKGLVFAYDDGATDDISLRHLAALRSFRMTFTHSPDTVDFSYNPTLESIDFSSSTVQFFDLANTPLVRDVNLMFNADFPAVTLNTIIHDLYTHVGEQNTRDGYFNLQTDFGGPMIGPPSAESVVKLRDLRDSYGWTINPVME
jgi:predicted heme/steroid binding protein